MISEYQRAVVKQRSGGRCEAMVQIKADEPVWTRCWATPTEMHHALTRARGGNILDEVHETYHLIDLCHTHHAMADGGEAYLGNMLIDGYVSWDDLRLKPIYSGNNHFLRNKYS